MWLARTKVGVLAGLMICASHLIGAQDAAPKSASDCRKMLNKSEFEGPIDGPSVIDIGYAANLGSCVVIRNQGFGWKHHKIVMHTDIYDTRNSKTLWTDQRIIPQGKHTNDRYPALLEELKALDIELAPR